MGVKEDQLNLCGKKIERWQEQRRKGEGPERCVEGLIFLGMDRVVYFRDVSEYGVHMIPHVYDKIYRKIARYIEF